MNAFDRELAKQEHEQLSACEVRILQVNIGLTCNQECAHCHVSSSPRRREQMSWATMEAVLRAVQASRCELVDITGGAPEMNPEFRRFVRALRELGAAVQVRTNLTILLAPGYEDLPAFYRELRVGLVASLPCYLEENVARQRGERVYARSIEAIRRLNEGGYGREEGLVLNLVYNPIGPVLPPDQASLEADYRRELGARHGIVFTKLLTIANMSIGRFRAALESEGRAQAYDELLRGAFNPSTLDGLMCRHQLTIGWDGRLYDCDFNYALDMPVNHGVPAKITEFDPAALRQRRVVTAEHCFGCTAGCGSSCGGALAP